MSGPTLDTTDEGYAPGAAAVAARQAFAPTGVAASAQAGLVGTAPAQGPAPPSSTGVLSGAAPPRGQPGPMVTSRGEVPVAPAKPTSFGDKIGRNDPCPCGSGKKYKKCHGRPGTPPA